MKEGGNFLKKALRRAERALLLKTLEDCDWAMEDAAATLGIDLHTLHRKLREHGIKNSGGRNPRNNIPSS